MCRWVARNDHLPIQSSPPASPSGPVLSLSRGVDAPFRMIHYYGYSHVLPRARMTCGQNVEIAPNASFRNGDRILLGDNVQIGEYAALWAGRSTSWIRVGARTTFGPGAFVTAADYGFAPEESVREQEMVEEDIVIGADCWIGAKAIITAGTSIGGRSCSRGRLSRNTSCSRWRYRRGRSSTHRQMARIGVPRLFGPRLGASSSTLSLRQLVEDPVVSQLSFLGPDDWEMDFSPSLALIILA